jgi:hypothetical protein
MFEPGHATDAKRVIQIFNFDAGRMIGNGTPSARCSPPLPLVSSRVLWMKRSFFSCTRT